MYYRHIFQSRLSGFRGQEKVKMLKEGLHVTWIMVEGAILAQMDKLGQFGNIS